MTGPPEESRPAGTGRGPRTWSLRARLVALFSVILVALSAVTAVSVASFVHLSDTRRTLLNQIDPASLQADRLFQDYLDEETGIRGYLLTRDAAFLEPLFDGANDQRVVAVQLAVSLRGHPELLRQAEGAQHAATQWATDFALPTVLARQTGTFQYAEAQLLGPGKTRFDVVRSRFQNLEAALSSERATTGATLSTATGELIAVLVVGLGLVVAAAIFLAWALRRWVVAPMSELGRSARRVADGELVRPIEPSGPPELVDLGSDVEAMRRRIVRELEEVASARADLAVRNVDLQRSNEELEQFAYVASHDLQEPLRKVTSFVQLLQQRYEGQLDERADVYIGYAVDGSKRMQDLINDLLAFSRVGRGTDDFVPVDLGAAARDAVDGLASLLAESGSTVDVGALPTVAGDRALLVSLFQNLVTNAVKFRGADPPRVTVTSRQHGSGWEVCVTDNGIGIDPRYAERVFVIFQRLHGRDAYEGTGIGLSLCKKIVEFHGGSIRVDSGYTDGARLCFTLPGGSAPG